MGLSGDVTRQGPKEDVLFTQRDLFINLCNVRDLATTLRSCLDAAIRVSGMECGGIYLADGTGGVRLAHSIGLSEAFVNEATHYPPGAPNSRLVMEGQAVYTRHAGLGVPLSETLRSEALRALAVIPICLEGRVMGSLNVASRTRDDVPPECRTGLEMIASIAGLLIERARVDEALLMQSAIVKTMAEGVCLVSASDGTIVYANPRFEQMFGYGPGEMSGIPVARINYPVPGRSAEAIAREIIAVLETKGEATCELCNVRKDGTPFWCEAHVSELQHPQFGRVWVAVHQDITERKRAEGALEQKNAALRELIEQVSAERGRVLETIASNLEDVVMPIVAELRRSGASPAHIDLLEHHLRDIASAYSRDVVRRKTFHLTPREIEICDMIKAGFSSSKIAKMLGLAVQTVQRHRRNIRRRLHITGTKENLKAFLASR